MAHLSEKVRTFNKVMGITLLVGIVAGLALPLSIAGKMYVLIATPIVAIAAGAFAATRVSRPEEVPEELFCPIPRVVAEAPPPAPAAIDEADARRLAMDAVVAKLRESLRLVAVDALPDGGYVTGQYRAEHWHLFYVSDANPRLRASDYVAVHRASGEVRYLSGLGA